MSRVLISSENSLLRNAFGLLAAAILVPVGIVGALVAGLFARPIDRTPDEVARYIRAMLNDTVNDEDSDFDYGEFSCVPIADPELESIARRACQAFEQGAGREPILQGLLKEAEALAEEG